MIEFDDVTKKNIKGHNPNRPQIPEHQCRISNWSLRIWKNKLII